MGKGATKSLPLKYVHVIEPAHAGIRRALACDMTGHTESKKRKVCPAQEIVPSPELSVNSKLGLATCSTCADLQHALALHFMHYNFARVHKTLGMTPAMAAGLADHPWSVGEIVALLPN